jgi:hypothetical protein
MTQLAYYTARPANGKQMQVTQEEINRNVSRNVICKQFNGRNGEKILLYAK